MALSKAASVPVFAIGKNAELRKSLRHHRGMHGTMDTNKMCLNVEKGEAQESDNEEDDPEPMGILGKRKNSHLLERMHNYLTHVLGPSELLGPSQMFHLLVDAGCLISTSPCKEDFEELVDLKTPLSWKASEERSRRLKAGLFAANC